MDPDPDPGGLITYGSATLLFTMYAIQCTYIHTGTNEEKSAVQRSEGMGLKVQGVKSCLLSRVRI